MRKKEGKKKKTNILSQPINFSKVQFTFKITNKQQQQQTKTPTITPKAKRVERQVSWCNDLHFDVALDKSRFGFIEACRPDIAYKDLETGLERNATRVSRDRKQPASEGGGLWAKGKEECKTRGHCGLSGPHMLDSKGFVPVTALMWQQPSGPYNIFLFSCKVKKSSSQSSKGFSELISSPYIALYLLK